MCDYGIRKVICTLRVEGVREVRLRGPGCQLSSHWGVVRVVPQRAAVDLVRHNEQEMAILSAFCATNWVRK
jgi:hypothetical protein